MTRTIRNVYQRRCITLAVILSAVAASATGQVSPATISVNDPRPLAKAAEALEREYGVPISYEDPAYAFSGDVVDKTDPQYKALHPDAKVLIPRGGSISVTMPSQPLNLASPSGGDPLSVIQEALSAHAAAGYPGQFKAVKTAIGYAVLPTGVRSTAGAVVAELSPFDTPISFPTIQRGVGETLKLICQTVSSASGRTLVLGVTDGIKNQVVSMAP